MTEQSNMRALSTLQWNVSNVRAGAILDQSDAVLGPADESGLFLYERIAAALAPLATLVATAPCKLVPTGADSQDVAAGETGCNAVVAQGRAVAVLLSAVAGASAEQAKYHTGLGESALSEELVRIHRELKPSHADQHLVCNTCTLPSNSHSFCSDC